MTALGFRMTSFAEMASLQFRAIGLRLGPALDAFAEARMRSAVPERLLRQADRNDHRFHRLLHPGRETSGTDRLPLSIKVGGVRRGARSARHNPAAAERTRPTR